jgi:hypothetical protein
MAIDIGVLTAGSEGNGGMIKVAEIESIRWRHFREGVSVQGLARC